MKISAILNYRRGFTLIEVLIVLSIIAVLVAVGMPFLSGFIENRNLNTAASDISGVIYQTKEKAMAEGNAYRISFSSFSNRYRIRQCTNIGLPCAGYNIISSTNLGSYGHGIALSAVSNIYFSPRGTVSGIAVGTAKPDNITITNNRGSQTTIEVSLTGRTNVTKNLK
jgi:prepilin-type N-terminal cleavage/methylation domain-containing protein